MRLRKRIGDSTRELLLVIAGFLGSRPTPYDPLDLGSPDMERACELVGGQLLPPPQARTRWYQRDIETAEHLANAGDLSVAAQLMTYAGRDGVLSGVLSMRTDGLVRLLKTFRGPTKIVVRVCQQSGRHKTETILPRSL